MHLQISSEHLEISDKVKKVINEKFIAKLDTLLHHFNEELKTANLHLSRLKLGDYESKFDMKLPGKDGGIFAKNSHPDLIASLIGLREEIETQIKKYKQNHSKTSLSS